MNFDKCSSFDPPKSDLKQQVGVTYFSILSKLGLCRVITQEDYVAPVRVTRSSVTKYSSPVNLAGDDTDKQPVDPRANEVYAVYPLYEDAVGAVTLRRGHLHRLEEGVYLNDELIDFRIRQITEELDPEVRSKIHVFNSHFYITLRDQGYEQVRKWTKNVDLFEKQFLFVPINESEHWSLVVIAWPGKVAELMPTSGGSAKKKKKATSTSPDQSSSSSSPDTVPSVDRPPSRTSENAMDVDNDTAVDAPTSTHQGDGEDCLVNTQPSDDENSAKSDTVSKDLPCFICMDSLNLHNARLICARLRRLVLFPIISIIL